MLRFSSYLTSLSASTALPHLTTPLFALILTMNRRRSIVLGDDDEVDDIKLPPTKRPKSSKKTEGPHTQDQLFSLFFRQPGATKGINSLLYPSRETFAIVSPIY